MTSGSKSASQRRVALACPTRQNLLKWQMKLKNWLRRLRLNQNPSSKRRTRRRNRASTQALTRTMPQLLVWETNLQLLKRSPRKIRTTMALPKGRITRQAKDLILELQSQLKSQLRIRWKRKLKSAMKTAKKILTRTTPPFKLTRIQRMMRVSLTARCKTSTIFISSLVQRCTR